MNCSLQEYQLFQSSHFWRSIHRWTNLRSSNVFSYLSPQFQRENEFFVWPFWPFYEPASTTWHRWTSMVWRKTAVTTKPSTWCMGSVWSYCQGGQLPWSTKSHISGQSNHSNHSVPRATIQVQHYFNRIFHETVVLTQKLILWGIFLDWVQQLDVALHVRGLHVFTGTLY